MAERYRKKPVVVEAMRFDGTPESGAAICAWAIAADGGAKAEYHPFLADRFKGDPKVYVAHPDPYMRIVAPGGTMVASPGDWIVRSSAGEFYSSTPEMFAATYEPA